MQTSPEPALAQAVQALVPHFFLHKATTMTTRTLSGATTDLVQTYGNTARNVINAYRVGNERVIGFMDQRWASALSGTGSKLSAETRSNALRAQKKLSAYYTQGYTLATDGADLLVGKAVALAGKGIDRAAANAGLFEKKTGVKALHSLALAAAPAVVVANKLASALEKQSGLMANKLAGRQAVVKIAAVKRVTPFRKARSRKAA